MEMEFIASKNNSYYYPTFEQEDNEEVNSTIQQIINETGVKTVSLHSLSILSEEDRKNELDYIYVCRKDINISNIIIQKGEVEDVKWISFSEFKTLLDKNKAVRRENVWECLFQNFKNC